MNISGIKIQESDRIEILANMSYFAKCKKYALKQILAFKKPINTELAIAMNIFYSSYFAYYVGLMDYMKDKNFINVDEYIIFFGNENDYYYVRNLRNAIIHRGEEVSNKGTEYKNIVVPFSPKNITNQSKNNQKTYQPFENNLLQIILKCENINSLYINFINNNKLIEYPYLTKEEFIKREELNLYIPKEFKNQLISEEAWKYYNSVKENMKKENIKEKLSYFDTSDLLKNL